MLPGDVLIGVSLNGTRAEEITHARDVQIYLDQARVGGQIHYLMKRPSYPPRRGAYYADLDNLGVASQVDAASYLHQPDRSGLSVHRFLRALQAGRTRAVRASLRDASAWRLCLSFLHAGREVIAISISAIAFLDNAAFILFAPLFLHFCVLYPTKQQLFATRRWRAVVLYVPAL